MNLPTLFKSKSKSNSKKTHWDEVASLGAPLGLPFYKSPNVTNPKVA